MKKAKILPPPDRELGNMDVFPDNLWMQPWRTALHGHDYNNPSKQPSLASASELPAWMSPAAKEEIMGQVHVDKNNGSRWWANLWDLAPSPPTQEFLFLSAAMAATYGWPVVLSDLLDKGAPLEMDKPEGGWKWLDDKGLAKEQCTLLDLCVHGMQGFTAVSPLHPKRAECLNVLLEAGANPNALTKRSNRLLMGQQAMAILLIEAGLDPRRPVNDQGLAMVDFLFSEDRGVAANVHGRMLRAFIKAGMPVRFAPDVPSIAQALAKTNRGLTQIEILFEHPDREAMKQALEEIKPIVHKKANTMSDSVKQSFIADFEVRLLELSTPPAPAVRASPRL